jgi:predicted nucleic acid-binding protein
VTVAKVVDASALAALVFGEAEAEEVVARLSGARLFAPVLLHFEIANTCLKKIRRHPKQRNDLVAMVGAAFRMGIEVVEVDYLETLSLAQETKLTVYDASYLWVARTLGAELVTLDEQLIDASN